MSKRTITEDSNADLICMAIRFVLTHNETYSNEYTEHAVQLGMQEDDGWLSFVPDRVNPGELLPKSFAHREARIKAWQAEAIRRFADVPAKQEGNAHEQA